ncbi:MAG: spore coat protein CotJB [Clostridia bacterium]|nr:spore coat protein CotJB [Clostridia bacterium]MBR5747084.1 spore coat protein CotJB [Clostridia bacterium]
MAELQKDALLRRIQEACFAAHECVLYLDGHPGNRKALSMHAAFTKTANELTAQYESRFGPLTANSAGGTGGWGWTAGKWPWQETEE